MLGLEIISFRLDFRISILGSVFNSVFSVRSVCILRNPSNSVSDSDSVRFLIFRFGLLLLRHPAHAMIFTLDRTGISDKSRIVIKIP